MTDPVANGTDPDSGPDPDLDLDLGPGSTSVDDEGPLDDPAPALVVTERSTPEGLLVSVCDEGLIGESLESDDAEVSLEVTETFYGGDTRDRDAAADALGRADVANLVGTRAVSLAVEVGLVDPANVLDLDGTPHAQFMQL